MNYIELCASEPGCTWLQSRIRRAYPPWPNCESRDCFSWAGAVHSTVRSLALGRFSKIRNLSNWCYLRRDPFRSSQRVACSLSTTPLQGACRHSYATLLGTSCQSSSFSHPSLVFLRWRCCACLYKSHHFSSPFRVSQQESRLSLGPWCHQKFWKSLSHACT